MTRILFVSYFFPPVGGAGVQRSAKFVKYLPSFGYEPVVLAGPGPGGSRWTPEDSSLAREVDSTVTVHRIASRLAPATPRVRLQRAIEGLDAGTAAWIDDATAVAVAEARDAQAAVITLGPYWTGALAGRLRALGIPVVLDFRDPWALDEMWDVPTRLHRALDLRRMRRALAAADAIVMNTEEAADRVRRLPEGARLPVVAIPNGFDAEDFAGVVPERRDGAFRIVHTGYLHTEDGFERAGRSRLRAWLGGTWPGVDVLSRSHVHLVEALQQLSASAPALQEVVELHLAGVLTDADHRVAERAPCARLHGYLPHAESIELLRTADLLFLPMHDLPAGRRAAIVPGKTYEYLAAARPILAAVPDGDARDLLAEAGGSLLCRPTDVQAMAAHIRQAVAANRAGSRPRLPDPAVVARFERRRLTEQLAAVVDGVCRARLR